jgi:hypothetical protein
MRKNTAKALYRKAVGAAPVPPAEALTSIERYRAWLATLSDAQLRAAIEREELLQVRSLSNEALMSELAKAAATEVEGFNV